MKIDINIVKHEKGHEIVFIPEIPRPRELRRNQPGTLHLLNHWINLGEIWYRDSLRLDKSIEYFLFRIFPGNWNYVLKSRALNQKPIWLKFGTTIVCDLQKE